jgi:hypothetical protein
MDAWRAKAADARRSLNTIVDMDIVDMDTLKLTAAITLARATEALPLLELQDAKAKLAASRIAQGVVGRLRVLDTALRGVGADDEDKVELAKCVQRLEDGLAKSQSLCFDDAQPEISAWCARSEPLAEALRSGEASLAAAMNSMKTMTKGAATRAIHRAVAVGRLTQVDATRVRDAVERARAVGVSDDELAPAEKKVSEASHAQQRQRRARCSLDEAMWNESLLELDIAELKARDRRLTHSTTPHENPSKARTPSTTPHEPLP